MCDELPEILAGVEVGHTVIFRDGKQKLVVAEQFIDANTFPYQDDPVEIITCEGGEPNVFHIDGRYYQEDCSDADIVGVIAPDSIHVQDSKQQPKCYALIADTSSIMGIYTTNQPDRDQILKCINAYVGYVPEITLEDTFNTLDTTCNSELDLDSTIGSAIDELLLHNITSLDMCNCEFTLDEFELEIGKSK